MWSAIDLEADDEAVRRWGGITLDEACKELTPAENHLDRFMKLIKEVGSVCVLD